VGLLVDHGGDHAFIDGVETVTFTPIDGGAAVATAKALRDELSFREVLVGAPLGIEPKDIVFVLWDSTLSSNEPDGGCTITDGASVVYTIISARRWGPANTQWRCICRKQVS